MTKKAMKSEISEVLIAEVGLTDLTHLFFSVFLFGALNVSLYNDDKCFTKYTNFMFNQKLISISSFRLFK